MDIYEEIMRFYENAETDKRILGKSLLGRNLYAVKVGEGEPIGIAVYAIHAREWITARLAVEHFSRGVVGTVWLVPLLNPDGALLSQKGVSSAKGSPDACFLASYSREDFRLWKANARGVDLNVNFDACWGKGVKNIEKRGVENCIGVAPFSENETKAIRDFTQEIAPDYTISFHTKGEEIYWYFGQSIHTCLRDFRVGMVLSKSTGYPLRLAKGSVGGYKDWCIEKLKISAFTVEVGNDAFAHPLGGVAYLEIKKKCGGALYALSEAVWREKYGELDEFCSRQGSGKGKV